jgi:hypothetical protein
MSPEGSIEHSATSRADSAIAEVRNTTQAWLGRMVSALRARTCVSGFRTRSEPRRRLVSGLAPYVELVGFVDEIGAALPMADEQSEQHRAIIANLVHVLLALRCACPGEQVID